ncbi:MAG: Rrf2 family transcriptional regulator [Bacteroidales bacterium]|jgi:Rrf2 family protein|nr:Rrf2 family transcriptional regulator [Bacteroidales bacterium]
MLSATCKYGIRAVIFIASKPDLRINTGLKEISDQLRIPQPYLAKILQTLARKKILHSTKGPHGGFYLSVPADKLTLMDIIDAIDGRNFFDSCYVTGEKCNLDKPDDGRCILHNDLREEKVRLERFFSSKTVEQLVGQVRNDPRVKI